MESTNEYCSRKDHRLHTPGSPVTPERKHYMKMPERDEWRFANRMPYVGKMDMAWTVMLFRQGLISQETAIKLLSVLPETQNAEGWGGEDWLKEKLGGDEDTASAVNYGRTLQEPMARMSMRDAILEVFEEGLQALEVLLKKADEHAETLMAGQSHFSHAQPTTYGSYLLAVHDGIVRGLEQLELAYRRTNENSGGCGACSGTGWPVDRDLITDLLGFEKTIEVAYDCEGSQDEIPQILYALSSMALTLSRSGMDHSIWTLEEIGAVLPDPSLQGVSSFMPQKAHGGMFENVRIAADEVIGEMMKVTTTFKGESIQDVLPVYKSPRHVFHGVNYMRQCFGLYRILIDTLQVNRERMREILANGYSGAPDLAIILIRKLNFGGRKAHRICCNFVRLARERGIKPKDLTASLLDEAARVTKETEPNLTDSEVQEAMTFKNFFATHNGQGDPHPDESRRLIQLRKKRLEDLQKAQSERRRALKEAEDRLNEAIREITQ